MRRALELAAHHPALAPDENTSWPARPGEARRTADGRVDMMYISPGRWLVCDPDDALIQSLLRASRMSTLTDVSGKWCRYHLHGSAAPRLLASALDTCDVLRDRDCARVALFDCPCILLAAQEGYFIYVQRSFAASLEEAVARVADLIGSC